MLEQKEQCLNISLVPFFPDKAGCGGDGVTDWGLSGGIVTQKLLDTLRV